jgi:hypothetical protein
MSEEAVAATVTAMRLREDRGLVGDKAAFSALRDWIPFSNKEGNVEHPKLCVT